ncbi:MAG: DUF512 domain-containing protein [Syntrophomonadaceae bacterium]
MAGRIVGVAAGSIAEEVGITAGDVLQGVDGHPIQDLLDYQYYSQDENISLEVIKPDGEQWLIEIEKDEGEDLGIIFDGAIFDRMKRCRNRCVFCFVDQLPGKMRKTLYVKDDDYRYSFMQGNFITLTNLKKPDWEKLTKLHLSPLYVSVHCLNPELRAHMLNNPQAADIKLQLQRLYDAGIEVHTQVVLCPGLNDGEVLQETIEGLAAFYPSVRSVGIVPVGLTGHRDKLAELQPVGEKQAGELIGVVDAYQKRFRSQFDTGFVYLADEFYIKTGREIPPAAYYDEYLQIENGVGLARQLLDEFDVIKQSLPAEAARGEYILVTGQAAAPVLNVVLERLQKVEGLKLELLTVPNRYFGGMVTVAGLITGSDIIKALSDKHRGKQVILPEVMLKDSSDLFLDNLTVGQIEKQSGVMIKVVDSITEAIEYMCGMSLTNPSEY